MANSNVPRAACRIRSWSDMLKKNESVQNPRKGRARKRVAGRTGGFLPPFMISSPELLIGGSDDEFRQVVYLFVKVLGRLMSCREAFGEAISLTGSQFAVLVGVAYRQGESGVTVKELSRYVHLAPTHVTTEVGRLHRRGLLVKKAGTEDRRSVLVSLTPEGEATVASVAPFVRRINDILFGGVTAAEFAAAHATFAKLARNSEYVLAELKQRH
jgi:MarR family transcriptional regulator, organic hydroperoxide resistance regulator